MSEEDPHEDADTSLPFSLYFQHLLHSIAGQRKFVDEIYLCDESISFILRGISNVNLNVENQSLHQSVRIMGYALKGIYEIYEEKYDFFEPLLSYCPTYSHLTLSVGLKERTC